MSTDSDSKPDNSILERWTNWRHLLKEKDVKNNKSKLSIYIKVIKHSCLIKPRKVENQYQVR
jgi:hypothetical protein